MLETITEWGSVALEILTIFMVIKNKNSKTLTKQEKLVKKNQKELTKQLNKQKKITEKINLLKGEENGEKTENEQQTNGQGSIQQNSQTY